jgi:hypothetical protein
MARPLSVVDLRKAGFAGLVGFDGAVFRWERLVWFVGAAVVATVVSLQVTDPTLILLHERTPGFREPPLTVAWSYCLRLLSSASPGFWFHPLAQSVLSIAFGMLLSVSRLRIVALAGGTILGALATPVAVQALYIDSLSGAFAAFDLSGFWFDLRTPILLVAYVGVLALTITRFQNARWAFLSAALAAPLAVELIYGGLSTGAHRGGAPGNWAPPCSSLGCWPSGHASGPSVCP